MINAEQYIPLVNNLAGGIYKKYRHRYEYEDLMQVGYVGLMRAIKAFDENRGTKFITFAWVYIKREILRYIRDDRWFLARNMNERMYNAQIVTSLDICVGEKKDTPIGDFISVEDSIPDWDLQNAIQSLPCELSSIIRLKYFCGYRQQEIGNKLGMSQTMVSRKEKKALNILKEMLQNECVCTA
ncbi:MULTISPECIES: sigma-70 family RNA polymerase sigma factor [Clostridium]|uniref:Sigma-70 family RNA polymerase sigma factor n=1 Tax=Clostridium lapidicellarium TaxID=3240931 RepID=A0ABV4DVY5_9CLOT